MASRSRTSTGRRHDRFLRIVTRAFARPVTDFKPVPARPSSKQRAKSESENHYFPREATEA